jgi:hypothetical protein
MATHGLSPLLYKAVQLGILEHVYRLYTHLFYLDRVVSARQVFLLFCGGQSDDKEWRLFE